MIVFVSINQSVHNLYLHLFCQEFDCWKLGNANSILLWHFKKKWRNNFYNALLKETPVSNYAIVLKMIAINVLTGF